MKSDTIQTRASLTNNTVENNSTKNGYTLLKHSRIFSSITDNQLSSRFALDENYSPFDNNVFMTNDEAMTHQSTTYDSSLTTVDDDISLEVTEDIQPPCEDCPLDITSDQTDLLKRFSKIKLNSTDIMQIDLFHLLKASNAPLVLFDRIISWVKRHKGNIAANGITDLSHRNTFIQNINQMLYGNDTFMKPIVEQI